MLRAVIFDFDGVIVDSELLHFAAFNQVLAQYGLNVSRDDYYKDYLGLTDAEVFGLFASQLDDNTQSVENLIKQKHQIFEKSAVTEAKVIESVPDFLQMLSQNNIPMAICSGSLLSEIELLLKQVRLRSFFEAIVSSEDVKKGKPNPEGFLLTLQKLNRNRQNPISANQCIVIEDSHWGLEAAKAAQMHTIAVTNSYDADHLALAEKVVADLSQLSISDLQQLCR